MTDILQTQAKYIFLNTTLLKRFYSEIAPQKKDYLFLEQGEGRKKGRERYHNVWEKHGLVSSRMSPTRDLAWTQACSLTQEASWWQSALQDDTKSTEPHCSGLILTLKRRKLMYKELSQSSHNTTEWQNTWQHKALKSPRTQSYCILFICSVSMNFSIIKTEYHSKGKLPMFRDRHTILTNAGIWDKAKAKTHFYYLILQIGLFF